MKILHVITSLRTGGAEKLLVETIPAYRKKGFDVDILVFFPVETPFEKLLKSQGVKVIYSYNIHIYNPLQILKVSLLINQYDLLHVHLFPGLYWVAFAKLLTGSSTKLVYTEHSTSNRRRNNLFLTKIDRFIYKQYNKIITIAEEVDILLKTYLRLSPERFILIKNGVNLDNIRNAAKSNIQFFEPENSKILIQVSSFREQKDQKTLIKAVALLPENINLLLVGDGPLINECKEFAKRLNLTNRIKFLGIRMDVPQLLKSADIVVLSSVHEGLSLSSVEGLASGRPFIASDVPGLREIVSGAGLLFPKGDENELKNIIIRLLNDREYYLKTVKSCEKRAEEYTLEKMVSEHIKLYEELIGKN